VIISKIVGGLGNQMCQYAFGRMHADRLNVQYLLDVRLLENSANLKNVTTRQFQLDRFNVRYDGFASEDQINKFVKPNFLIRGLNKIRSKKHRSYISEKSHYDYPCYEDSLKLLRDGKYLEGYWVNKDYFISNFDNVVKDFTLSSSLSDKNRSHLSVLQDTVSVAIHIRRGDFVNNKKFVLPTLDYYHKSIAELDQRFKIDSYVFFSDDISWAKSHFEGSSSFFVENSDNPEVDIFLMSQASHNIIANSTFSWWSALLNNNKDKVVIAPKLWYTDLSMQKNASFIIPDAWSKI